MSEPPPLPPRTLQYQSPPVYVPPPENPTVTGIGTAIAAFAVIMLAGLGVFALVGFVMLVIVVINH